MGQGRRNSEAAGLASPAVAGDNKRLFQESQSSRGDSRAGTAQLSLDWPQQGNPPVDQEVCAEIVIPTRLWVGPHYEGDIQPCVRGGGQVLPWGSSFYLIFLKCRQHEILNIEMLGESQDLYFFIVLSKICSWNVAMDLQAHVSVRLALKLLNLVAVQNKAQWSTATRHLPWCPCF